MVRSALFSRHHADAASEWTNHDAWFRSRMVDQFDLDDNSAEKMSRFILSLFMANEIDYSFERQLFKYYKISPNSRPNESINLDYVDGKSALRVAIEELSSVTESTEGSAQLVRELVAQIETGRRKRKVSETQSVGSSRSSSSSSSYEEEFPSLGGNSVRPVQPNENSHWITPQLIPITKSPKSSSPRGNHKKDGEKKRSSSDNEKYRFAFKNPKKKEKTSTTPTPKTQTPPPGDIVCKKQPNEQPKKTKTKSGRPPDDATNQGNKCKESEKCKKRERNRKRKRPRKKKSPQKTDSSKSISPVPPIPRNQNLDSFSSLDDALVFLKNQSGSEEPRDATIWRKVMEDQHVKYVNGSFFFSPRIKMPIRQSRDTEASESKMLDPLLEHAAKIAYRTVSTIFDDEGSEDGSPPVRIRSPFDEQTALSISDDKWPVKCDSNPVWTTDSW